MNGRPGISSDTRERVLAIATELGYQHVPAGRRAAPQPATATGQIGVVLSATGSGDDGHPNYYVAELLAGVEDELAVHGFRLNVTVWSGELPVFVREREAAGVLFLGGSFPVEVACRCELPAVLVGTSFPQWPYDSVLADNRKGAYLAVRHLLAGGARRRVALLNGPATTRTSESKLLGYRDALDEAGIALDESLIGSGDFTAESGREQTRRLLERRPDIDALFVADDPMAIGALRALEELGRRVPDDLPVIGYGNSPMGALVLPALSTVQVFQRQLGLMGARRLINRLNEEDNSPVQTLISPQLLLRATAP
jgi:DNA-binding LacI/PurR family transcriptional regulator